MALISCPECGKKNISDSAVVCPDCGYGIRRHMNKVAKNEKKKEYITILKRNRKILVLVISLILMLVVFTTIAGKSPDIIKLGNKRLSYYATSVHEDFSRTGISIKINDEGRIRCISIQTPDVDTYKGICVGDTIDKVTAKYKYEMKSSNMYMVLFNGRKEIDLKVEEKKDDYLWITYLANDRGRIEKIQIYDYKYGFFMK